MKRKAPRANWEDKEEILKELIQEGYTVKEISEMEDFEDFTSKQITTKVSSLKKNNTYSKF